MKFSNSTNQLQAKCYTNTLARLEEERENIKDWSSSSFCPRSVSQPCLKLLISLLGRVKTLSPVLRGQTKRLACCWHSGADLRRKYPELHLPSHEVNLIFSQGQVLLTDNAEGACSSAFLPEKCSSGFVYGKAQAQARLRHRHCSTECLFHALAELHINATFQKPFFSLTQLSERCPSHLWDGDSCNRDGRLLQCSRIATVPVADWRSCESCARLPKHSARCTTSATDSGPPTELGQSAVFEMIELSASHSAETLAGTNSCRIQYVHVK